MSSLPRGGSWQGCVAVACALIGPPCLANPPALVRLSEIEAGGAFTWVEIESLSAEPQSLHGYSIQAERVVNSDERRGRIAHEFAADVSIPGKASVGARPFLVVCFGGFPEPNVEPECNSDACYGEVCLPFELDKQGGKISLLYGEPCKKVERVIVDSVVYPPMPPDSTFGRDTAGGWCILERKTPGLPNIFVCRPRSPRVLINEISSYGDRDWIELLLVGEDPVSLLGYTLWSRGSQVALPPVVLSRPAVKPEGCDTSRAVIAINRLGPLEASCTDRTFMVAAPFALNAKGDSLALIASDGSDSDRVVVPELSQVEVFARIPDGGELTFTTTPTPSTANEKPGDGLAPECMVIDRFPLRVTPADPVEIYARVIDRDGQGDLRDVSLHWDASGAQGSTPMDLSKRITCKRFEEPGIFRASIPAGVAPPGSDLEYWIVADDRQGHRSLSGRLAVFVQHPDWTDPQGAHLLRINEVAADEAPRPGDWVEIYNSSTDPLAPPIYLGNMYITEDVFRLDGRRLPAAADEALFLEPGGFLRVWLTDEVAVPGPRLAFRLDDCRDEVLLIHSDGKTVIDSIQFHEEKPHRSLGRLPDGGPDVSVMNQTPGSPNQPATCFNFKIAVDDSPLVINEVCSDNWTSGEDAGHEHGDWIEIFNRSSEPQSLACWRLSDSWGVDPEGGNYNTQKIWSFPDSLTLLPRDFRLVWCDNDEDCETFESTGELHTSFQLNRGSDFVQLLDPCGRVADHVFFKFQPRDISLGRFPDGRGAGAFLLPTPGQKNDLLPPSRAELQPVVCFNPPPELTTGTSACDPSCQRFFRGDADGTCGVDLADAVVTLNWLFLGSRGPACMDAADSNDDGNINLADAVLTLGYLFQGRPPPPPPGPEDPGVDPTDDGLPDCGDTGCGP